MFDDAGDDTGNVDDRNIWDVWIEEEKDVLVFKLLDLWVVWFEEDEQLVVDSPDDIDDESDTAEGVNKEDDDKNSDSWDRIKSSSCGKIRLFSLLILPSLSLYMSNSCDKIRKLSSLSLRELLSSSAGLF